MSENLSKRSLGVNLSRFAADFQPRVCVCVCVRRFGGFAAGLKARHC